MLTLMRPSLSLASLRASRTMRSTVMTTSGFGYGRSVLSTLTMHLTLVCNFSRSCLPMAFIGELAPLAVTGGGGVELIVAGLEAGCVGEVTGVIRGVAGLKKRDIGD